MGEVKQFIRPWLKEAHMIAHGSDMKPKKEHVKAAIEALEKLHKEVQILLTKAYVEACKKRVADGKPKPTMSEFVGALDDSH